MKFKSQQTAQKLRGGYYTPQHLADFITKWVLTSSSKHILEPSCGDGVFFQALSNNACKKDIHIKGFELIDTESEKSKERCSNLEFSNAEIHTRDFLDWAYHEIKTNNKLFDGIIGNPPFIRYQFLEKEFQKNTENIFNLLDLKFTKHTNAWVPFVLSSLSLLKNGGRLGMVIPSEIINVMHAQSLRTYLGALCSKIVIIDPQEIWFADTLQGAVILLAEKKVNIEDYSHGVAINNVMGLDFIKSNPEHIFNEAQAVAGEIIKGKWTKAVLDPDELKLLNKVLNHPSIYKFDQLAKVEVGIVTGANDFFLVKNSIVKKYNLEAYAKPMFGRSQHCQGVIYNADQHNLNAQRELPTNFIYIKDTFDNLPKKTKEYIQLGESEGLHTRYKCRIRQPWYKVPSVFSRKICMLKRAHDTPRLIFNELEAYTTDTAYRIESKSLADEKLTYCFINPLTAIFSEIEGRSYGGGVLELVPSEIRKLFIPIPEKIDFDIKELDYMVRTLSMTDVLKIQGEKIFGILGFNHQEIMMLLNIWIKLKNRRQRISDTSIPIEENKELMAESL